MTNILAWERWGNKSNILKKYRREELVLDVKKEVVLALTYFVHFSIILENRWWNCLMLCSVFVKETLTIIQFQWYKITSCWLIFIFNVFNQSSKRNYAKYGIYTDIQTYFSEKNIWLGVQVFWGITGSKFQGNRSVLSNEIGCGCLIAICYRNIPHCVKSVQIRSFFWSVFSCIRTEYGEILCRKIRSRKNSVFGHFSRSSSLSYFVRRSDFQTNILKTEIIRKLK